MNEQTLIMISLGVVIGFPIGLFIPLTLDWIHGRRAK